MNKTRELTKSELMFRDGAVWKVLLKLALPSLIMMLVMGSYFFFDNVLSINFAGDAYSGAQYKIPGMDGSSLVRIFMNGYSPINSLMIATALLFGVGIGTRTAINLGKGDRERAKRTIRAGFMIGMVVAMLLTPVLILTAQIWIESQYKSMDARSIQIIGDNAFKYAWPVILSFPMIMFNNIIPSLLRNEARMKQMMVAIILPIFVNLLLDWVFMGPIGMGVEGGAWATFTSNALTTLILVFWIFKSEKTSLLRWKILIGKNIKYMAIIGILFIGVAPFLRNMAQSITSSVQTNIINEVSASVFKDDYISSWNELHKNGLIVDMLSNDKTGLLQMLKVQSSPEEWKAFAGSFGITDLNDFKGIATAINKNIPADIFKWHVPVPPKGTMTPEFASYSFINGIIQRQASSGMISIMSGAMPVFVLFFPTMFAFVQAAGPVASYNYGAKQYGRVRKVYWWTLIYAGTTAVIIYFLVAWGISGPLIDLLKVSNTMAINSKEISIDVLKIIMISMIAFVFGIGSMVIFSSTDRVFSSIITSSLQGLILIWVVIYPFKEIAINNIDQNTLFFWYLPVLSGLTSLVATAMVIRTLYVLNKKYQLTLDERVDSFYELQTFYKNRAIALKKAKKEGNYNIAKTEWKEKRKADKLAKKEKIRKAQSEVDKNYAAYKLAKQK